MFKKKARKMAELLEKLVENSHLKRAATELQSISGDPEMYRGTLERIRKERDQIVAQIIELEDE